MEWQHQCLSFAPYLMWSWALVEFTMTFWKSGLNFAHPKSKNFPSESNKTVLAKGNAVGSTLLTGRPSSATVEELSRLRENSTNTWRRPVMPSLMWRSTYPSHVTSALIGSEPSTHWPSTLGGTTGSKSTAVPGRGAMSNTQTEPFTWDTSPSVSSPKTSGPLMTKATTQKSRSISLLQLRLWQSNLLKPWLPVIKLLLQPLGLSTQQSMCRRPQAKRLSFNRLKLSTRHLTDTTDKYLPSQQSPSLEIRLQVCQARKPVGWW